jgi:putative Holliday junction resolvase
MRILAIDPGEKQIGIAISDPTGTIANPLTILPHTSRKSDAVSIAHLAEKNEVELIVVGVALDSENQPTMQSRRSVRLAAAISNQSTLPVVLWDESNSSNAIIDAQSIMKTRRRRKRKPIDDLAATYILQTYLDAHQKN